MPEDVWGEVVSELDVVDVVSRACEYTSRYMDDLWFNNPDVTEMLDVRTENVRMLVETAMDILADGELLEIGLCGLMC